MLGSASWSLQAVAVDVPEKIEQLQAQLQLLRSEEKKLALMVGALARLSPDSPGYSLELADEALRLAVHLKDSEKIPLILYRRGAARHAMGEMLAAMEDFRDARDQLLALHQEMEAAEVAMDAGEVALHLGRPTEAIEWYHRALNGGSDATRARAYSSLASLHTDHGDLLHALDYAHQALALTETHNEPEPLGVVLASIGVIYALLEDHDAAYDCLARSLEAFQRAGSRYLQVRALSNLGQLHLWRGELEPALEYATISLLIYEELGDSEGISMALAMIGSIHERQDDRAVALDFHLRGYEKLQDVPPSRLHTTALLSIGRLRMGMGDADAAAAAMRQALAIADWLGDTQMRAESHACLATLCDDVGDLRGAIDHHRATRELEHLLAAAGRHHEIATFRMRLESEQGENNARHVERRVTQLEQEVDEKQKELAAVALKVVKKSALLESMRKGLLDLSRKTEGSARTVVEAMLTSFRVGADEQEAWSAFEAQFQHVHGEFLRILAQRFPRLTPTEMKICALLRTGLPSKETASMLHMSPRTVESHRYSIRKKLGLSTTRNLNAFLAGIAGTDGESKVFE